MADEELQARLQSHSKAFEGLMSLIPAKAYYGEDNENQWKRKKQTKEEKRAAKKAKLDPASNKSALDIQNERKRKRDQEADDDVDNSIADLEQPRQGLKGPKSVLKKQKLEDETEAKPAKAVKPTKKPATEADVEATRQAHVEKRRIKRERQKERVAKAQAKKETKADGAIKSKKTEAGPKAKPAIQASKTKTKPKFADVQSPKQSSATVKAAQKSQANETDEVDDDEEDNSGEGSDSDDDADEDEAEDDEEIMDDEEGEDSDNDEEGEDDAGGNDIAPSAFPGLAADDLMASDSSDSEDESVTFDNAQESSASSASSILPDSSNPAKQKASTTKATEDQPEDSTTTAQPREKLPKLPQIDPQLLQERLQARLNALRAARKADGPNGKPAKNRQELIEARRKKEESRKAHKKEVRMKAKLAQDAEAEAARLRGGSGSPMWSPGTFSPREPENNFSFGRVAFDDGAEMDSSLTTVLDPRKKKGPQDVKTALEAAQNKRARISGLDPTKRADIEEKDRWLNAKKRINGEKVRDDTNLLKKTLKRKEKGKAKSEKEWNERIEGVKMGKEAKQKRREENLQKRREGKGVKGKKKPAGKPKGGVKKRPGFEGSFRAGGRSK